MIYKAIWYRKANVWIVEANNAKLGLRRRLRLNPDDVHVISNTCSQYYFLKRTEAPCIERGDKVRFLCISAYYEHKNLTLIPEIARHLRDMDDSLAFEFVITLPVEGDGYKAIAQKATNLGVEENICNIGAVRVCDGPDLYESCHIVFLPSLLETFSANYPEAMAMSRPIVTTDLDFAHDACKEAALYFEPTNAKSAADKLLQLVNEPDTQKHLVSIGKEVLKHLPTPEQRYDQFIEVIKTAQKTK